MNRIVRENYPVADLPEDLRKGLSDDAHLRVVIKVADAAEPKMGFSESALAPPDRVLSLEELFAMRRPPSRTTEEIVADIRQQRDEWDD